MKSYPWILYTNKLRERILYPKCVGCFTKEEALSKGLRLVLGAEGDIKQGHLTKIYLLVNPIDGMIVDARFQVFGPPALVGAVDALCEMLLNKNYAQASRISTDLIDKKLRDSSSIEAFSEGMYIYLNWALTALLEATSLCQDIPITAPYRNSPVVEGHDQGKGSENHHYEEWASYTTDEKLAVIRDVIKQEIEPYVALDEGGVEVTEIKEDKEVIVVYQGSCTSCFSAIGATLNAIQQILRDKVHPELVVTPDTSVLKF